MTMLTIEGRDPASGRGLALSVADGHIARIEESSSGSDLYLAPGLIDLQVNGFSGFDLNAESITVETVSGLADVLLRHGVTRFAPTLITASQESTCERLQVIADAHSNLPRVAACVPFIHVEGPHISPLDGYRGAHPAEFVRPPSIAEFEHWQAAAQGLIGMVTLSPHFAESLDYIRFLVQHGVRVSIGHTHASKEQIAAAVGAGASLSTHLGNGIAGEIPRHRNPIWSQLADDRLTASFIADGHHLPSDALKSMFRAKGLERLFLVSDAVALGGMPAGVYDTPVGGRVELHSNGRLCVYGTEMLAGSATPLIDCVSHVVRTAGITLGDALALATVNPGKVCGGIGKLEIGARADFIRFRWQDRMVLEDVWLAGERVGPEK